MNLVAARAPSFFGALHNIQVRVCNFRRLNYRACVPQRLNSELVDALAAVRNTRSQVDTLKTELVQSVRISCRAVKHFRSGGSQMLKVIQQRRRQANLQRVQRLMDLLSTVQRWA